MHILILHLFSLLRTTRAEQTSGALNGFLQSLLPGYNPNEVVEGAAAADRNQGAAGGLREPVVSLMDALRQLLQNMHQVPEDGDHPPPDVQEWD